MIEDELLELLRLKDGKLYHREGRTLEFKEQFNLAGLADYFRDFAAFANNRGGFVVFGVKDRPRELTGLNSKSARMFEDLDPERISGFLGNVFSSEIKWESVTVSKDKKTFAAFKVYEAETKPVIALADEGKGQIIRNGDIYYRYGGRTQRILSGELQAIIQDRVEANNNAWMEHVQTIGLAGPQKSVVLSTSENLAQKSGQQLVIDEKLARQLRFLREGKFDERDGALALKLVGDVVSVDAVEIEKTVEEKLFAKYPFSATEVYNKVKSQLPNVKKNRVWEVINENGLKGDDRYSRLNFRNRAQEAQFEKTGRAPSTTPVIYNEDAIKFIVNILNSE